MIPTYSAVFITECRNRLVPEPHQSTNQRVTKEVVSRGSECPVAVSTWGTLGWITLKTHPRDLADVRVRAGIYNGAGSQLSEKKI